MGKGGKLRVGRRNDVILCCLFALQGASMAVTAIFAPFLLLSFTGTSYVLVALVFALPSLGCFLGGHLWGPALDQVGRLRPFLLFAGATSVVFLSILARLETAWLFVAMASIAAFFQSSMRAPSQAYVTLRSPESMGRALSWLFTAEAIGWTLSTLVAGFVFTRMASDLAACRALLQGMAFLWAIVTVLAFFFRDEGITGCTVGQRRRRSLIREIADLYGQGGILGLALVVGMINGTNTLFFGMFSTYFCKFLGGGKDLLGVALAAAGLAGALVFPLLGRLCDRVGRWRILVGAAAGYGLLFLCFTWLRSPIAVAVLYAIPIYPAMRVAGNAAAADFTAGSERGGGMGIVEGAIAFSGFIGPVCGGAVVEWLGFVYLPATAAVAALLGVILTLGVARRFADGRQKAVSARPGVPAG